MRRAGCHDAERWAGRKADGTLPVVESAELEGHLAGCPVCARREALLGAVSDGLRRATKPLPPGFADRVMRRLPADASQPVQVFAQWRWLPIAAGLLLVAGLTAYRLLPQAANAPLEPPRIQVELELADVAARTVAVAGDFNGWDAARLEQGADGVWRIRLSLQPGRYRYAFVIDGERWVADPSAPTVVDSGYGGANAVLEVSL